MGKVAAKGIRDGQRWREKGPSGRIGKVNACGQGDGMDQVELWLEPEGPSQMIEEDALLAGWTLQPP